MRPKYLSTETLSLTLFIFSLGVYAFTRFYAIDQFPIYFFTDEAIQPVHAADLLQRGFRDAQGNLFPTYFQNGQYWNLSFSVYVHTLSVAIFGKSIIVTRATSAVVSVLSALAVGLILRLIFNKEWGGIAILFLAATPAWFLHSRTAFETVMMVSLYCWFLLCYLLYRYRSPYNLFPALVLGAATFYSYSNGQAVMLLSGILLFFSDFRYHLQHWRFGLVGVGLLILLVLPYVRFQMQYPDILTSYLHILNSYWLQPLSLPEKLGRFLTTYSYGFSPLYWFLPNNQDLARHQMKGYGHLSLWVLPLFLVGLGVSLQRIQSSAHRAIIIAALAAPFGSALAEIAITRALLFVVPVSIFATLGFDALVSRLRSIRLQWGVVIMSCVVLAILSFSMLRDALVHGPTWFTNYGLYGMQWGAKQLFEQMIPEYLREVPEGRVYVTHTWSNGTDVFMRFFGMNSPRVEMESVLGFMDRQHNLDPTSRFIMTKEEYIAARASTKFKDIAVERTIHYPDGTDGFYLARVAYVDNIDAIFEAERQARRQLVTEPFDVDGEPMQIGHTQFDMGGLRQIFDDDPYTVARGIEMNPLILEFEFSKPRPLRGLRGIFGRAKYTLTLLVYPDGAQPPLEYKATFNYVTPNPGLPSGPPAEMEFDRGPSRVSKIHMEILYLETDANAHVHIFDLKFQ